MSGILNKLGLGGDHHASNTSSSTNSADQVAREAGKTHTNTVENAAGARAGQTTTTTTTTTNKNTGSTLGSMNQSDVNTTAPYGSSSNATTSRTGAAYSNTGMTGTNTTTGNELYTQRTGVTGDDAITRSEEQLHVAKARVETGKAELNKYVTTEHVEQAVPVQRERVIIEREPINSGNMDKALSGPEISEAHYETTLSEDRVAATKETVPIERIRLAKQTETSVESVGADLRKEHVDFTHTQLAGDKVDNLGHSNLHGNKTLGTAGHHTTGHHTTGTTTGHHTTGTTTTGTTAGSTGRQNY